MVTLAREPPPAPVAGPGQKLPLPSQQNWTGCAHTGPGQEVPYVNRQTPVETLLSHNLRMRAVVILRNLYIPHKPLEHLSGQSRHGLPTLNGS